jgi:uncharacterized membrane protein (DUF106 family)
MYFIMLFAWLKYFTYHLELVLAPAAHFLPTKARKVYYSLVELYAKNFILIYLGGTSVKFTKHFNGGTSYTKFGNLCSRGKSA